MNQQAYTIGLRLSAIIIDIPISLGCLVLYFNHFIPIFENPPGDLPLWAFVTLIPLGFLSPILYFVIPTWLFGKTIGKWICGLRVYNIENSVPLSLPQVIGREVIKLIGMAFNIGSIIGFIQICMDKSAFWDSLCKTEVLYTRGLTSTQKNWRKAYKR